jgi:hypothetical protein
MATITKEHAKKIAKKMKAIIVKGTKAHDYALVYHDGVIVAQFGIRRGSKKNLGHGHIPGDLQLSPHDTVLLANCPLSRDEWIRRVVGPDPADVAQEEE